ncbi:conserved Plasmodium protein, unknown function [Plasmodium berghei]|uniref:Uncharacterized protein n=1 Tax=Plasmodium berghei TaxID=5821 RepID=A0A1D3LXJ5_PLABE|nr:conserved Plasmodium protein, unknown function [Plasmodium berghei]
MSDNGQNETNKTKLHYNDENGQTGNISNGLLNDFTNYLKRKNEPGYPKLYLKDTRNQSNVKNPKIKNEAFIDYGLYTHIIENIVDIDDNNLPYINNEYKSYINSKNIILIIDIYVYNLFFHFKYISKNINNYYLCFNKIAYPFHFSFHNNNTCENCTLKENNNYECKQKINNDNDVIGQTKNCDTPKKCYYNKKGKNKNEFLPKILYMWCKRLKLAISIYNDNKIKHMKKKDQLKKNSENSEQDIFIYNQNSRYSVNECIKKLEEITFHSKSYDAFKNIYFISSDNKYVYSICNNILISNSNKSTKLKEKNNPNFIQNFFDEVKTKWEKKKNDKKQNLLSKENHIYDSELYNTNVTDLYLINLVKCKIEEYFKNVQIKKFWDIINVRNLIEFDYKQINKKTNNKIDSNVNSRKYNESIYEYIQIIKKTKCKKDIKTNEITKNCYKIKRNISHNNTTSDQVFEKKKLEKKYIIKDMFNNTMKDYNVNEIQIYLSNYDNIFFKIITSFYLLLNFSVEIMSILYEDLDLYSYYIFSLYEKINKYLYNDQNNIENNNFDIYQKKKDLDSDQNHSKKINCYKTYGIINNGKNDKIYTNCNSSNVHKNNKKYNFLIKVNNYFNNLSHKDIKFDSAVFVLLKLFIENKCDEEQKRCKFLDNNNNTNYEPICKRLKIEKYKEILKEIKILINYLINKNILKGKHNLNYIINVFNKYDKKIKELKHSNYVNNKYVDILKKNFLLYSLNFYEFEFFSNKYIDNYLNILDQSKSSKKIRLKIPSRIYITKALNKYVAFRKKIWDINIKLYGNCFFKPHVIDNNYIIHPNGDKNGGDKFKQVFIKITMKKIKRKQRNIYLRKLANKVYTNFKVAHNIYTSFKESGNKKFDKEINKKKHSYHNDNVCVNGEDVSLSIEYHKNGFIKKLNLIKLKLKICNIIKRKNMIYKKVIKKIKERKKAIKKSKLKNSEIYYNKFVDLFKNLKNQDITIRNSLYNMVSNINEHLNIYYSNICHCAQSDIFGNKDVEHFMKKKLEILKDGIHLYFTHENIFEFDKNYLNSQNQTNLNNEENDNCNYRNINPNSMNGNDIFTDICENNVTNNSEIKLSNTSNYSSLLFLNTNKNIKKNNFRELERIEFPFSHSFNDTKLQSCTKCHSKLDTNILRKKKKLLYNLFNLQNYYKKKKRKTNYLAYDINILKEYLYIYLKKYFDDIIVLFEYFYFYFSNNTIHSEYTDGNANNINDSAYTKIDNENKNRKHKVCFYNIFNSKCDEKNEHGVGIYSEENIYSKRSIGKEINNQDNEKNDDLIYEYFFLCSYDNFNNGSDLDNMNIKDKNKYSKHYINYIFTKKLRLFIKNDLIQFINRNINLINNNINLKIISIKRLFGTVLNNIKLSNSTNSLFIYQILYSMIIKYAKYNQNKIIKKNIMNKLYTWEWSHDANGDIEKKISFLKKKKKYLQKFGLDLASLSKDVIVFLKYITTFDSTKLDYSNMDNDDKNNVHIQKEIPSEGISYKNNIKKKRYSNYQIENTTNSFYINNNDQLDEYNINDLSLNSFFCSLSNCRDIIYLKTVFHKMIKKKKKNIITITETPESIIKWNKNKCKHVNKTKDDEEYFEQFSHIYEIIKQKSLKKYDNLKLFITIDKKKRTRKRKLDYDENLMSTNFYNDNTNIMIKKVKKYIIKFIDDNKYVFPYIFNTFDNSTNYELNSYDIINLNNNFIFFHYINNKSEYSFKNSILNYIYGYPILNVYTKNEDFQSYYIKDISNNHRTNNNIYFDQKEKGVDKSEIYQECHNKYKTKNCNDNIESNIYKEIFNQEIISTLDKQNVNVNKKMSLYSQNNNYKIQNFRAPSFQNKNCDDKYYNKQNKKYDERHIERLQKIRQKNQRKNLINIFNNVKIFNKIPLKYIHLCVISDIFKCLNLHHIIQDIVKNLYIEKLKEIQEKFFSSKNNNSNLSNILICFLFYFYSYLDIILGIRDGNFINLTNFNNFNIFNNFNDILLKGHNQTNEGNNAYMKDSNNKNKNKENYYEKSFSEDIENIKESYIYLDNELSHRNNYLWILKRKEKNVLSIPCVDEIYLKLRSDKKVKNSYQTFSTNFVQFLNLYLDYNYSFLNSAKYIDENKSQLYLFVQNEDTQNNKDLEKVYDINSVSNCDNNFFDNFLRDNNKTYMPINAYDEENENIKTDISISNIFKNIKYKNVLYNYSNISINLVESDFENYNSSLFLSKINLINSMRYCEKNICCLKNYELIKEDVEKNKDFIYSESNTLNNINDICSNKLMERIKLILDILRTQLNGILDKKKKCIINSLTSCKVNKTGLEDIKFAYYLIHLFDFEQKQANISDIYIYKNIYYSLIESLFTKNSNNTNSINCEQIIYIIFNLIKITRIIKIKNKQIRKLFKLLQKYLQNFPDFFSQIFNKIFLFIYQDTKFENKLFLKKYLNVYFNDKRIILDILNHIITSARNKKATKSLYNNKDRAYNKKTIHENFDNSSTFYDKNNECIYNGKRQEESKNMSDNDNNKNDMLNKWVNAFPLTGIQHNNNRKNRKKNRNPKKKNFSHFNYEIIKKVFLKCKNIYSSDTNSSSNGNIFKIKNIKNQNYKQYEEEKKKNIFEKIKKNKVPLAMSKGKYEGNHFIFSNDMQIKWEKNTNENIHNKKHDKNKKNMLKNKKFGDYSSDDFINNIFIQYNKNEKIDKQISMVNVNNYGLLYYNKCHDKYESSDSSLSNYTSDTLSYYSTNSSNNKDKFVFDMNDINIDNSGKLLSRLSTIDLKGIKQNEEIKYYETNDYSLYDNINKDKTNDPTCNHKNNDNYSSSEESICNNNKKNDYFYNFLNSNKKDNSFCFIKYKSYHEFNNKKRRKIKKYKRKEKKEKKKKTAVMYMPLYISIVGGLDFFLYKYYNYICETYINPYFYINTYYFEKYIRKKYKNLRKKDNYLVYDFYYYNYMFLNKFTTFDSFNSIKDKKVEINKYIKFFNFKINDKHPPDLIYMEIEKYPYINNSGKCNNYIPIYDNMQNENMLISYNGKKNELDDLIIPEKKNMSNIRLVGMEKPEEEKNSNIRNISRSINTENNGRYMNSYNTNKNGSIEFYSNLNQVNNIFKLVDDNFFYTENSLSSDDEEDRTRKKNINDIHIFKRNLFIIEYFENYFNFSLLTHMRNILLDMFENYNLNLAYINKYILINEKNDKTKDPYLDMSIMPPNFSNPKPKYYKNVCPEWSFVKLNSSRLNKIKEINYNNSINIIESQNDSYYNNALKIFFYDLPIQISMTILNPEYWKFESLKEDQTLTHIIPECVQNYLNIINNIYQKYNVDKYLIFLYDLCYIDLNINDYMYTFKLPDGLFFLFLSNIENNAIDVYKNTLFLKNTKKESNNEKRHNNIRYNYDYIFISSNYKHKENKTLHIIINDNIILYDFHIIQNHQSFNAPTKKKRDKFQTGQEWETTEGAEKIETSFIYNKTKKNTKDCQLIKLENGKNTEKNEHMFLSITENNFLKKNKIIEIKDLEKNKKEEYSITNVEENKNGEFVDEVKIEKMNKCFNSKDWGVKCGNNNNNNNDGNKMLLFKNKNPINKQISRENIYYNLKFLKDFQEKEIEKIKNIQNINDIYIKMFFTEEYLIQNTQFSEKYIKEMVKKLNRDKFLQKNTFKVMNKQNNKTTQFTVYCIIDFDTNLDENKIKNISDPNQKSIKVETQLQTWKTDSFNNHIQTKDNNVYPHDIIQGEENGNSIIIETKKMNNHTIHSFSNNSFKINENCIIEKEQLVSLLTNDTCLNDYISSQNNENKIDIHNINKNFDNDDVENINMIDIKNIYNKKKSENSTSIFNKYYMNSNRNESNEYFINRKIKGSKEKGHINRLHIKIGKIVKNNEKIKKDEKNINKLNKINKLSNDQNILVNNLVPYISRSSMDKDKIDIDNDLILGNTNGINEPVDYFLDDVATDDDEEKEIKRRKTFDNLNLEGSYEFYESEILKITKNRMNKMMSEPGKNISTPLFLIVNNLNKTLQEMKLKTASQPEVLAILNIMLKKNKITRVGGNWQPI